MKPWACVNWVLLALVGYLAIHLTIGARPAPKTQTEWFGAETCIASAGRAYEEGFALTSAEPSAYGITLMLTGLILAVPIWRMKPTTMADFFRQRYDPRVEIAALMLIPPGVLWAAAQLRGFGQVLTTIMTMELGAAITIAAAFCVVYTVLGGLLADAFTDLIQGAVLTLALAILLVVVVMALGGPVETGSPARCRRTRCTPARRCPQWRLDLQVRQSQSTAVTHGGRGPCLLFVAALLTASVTWAQAVPVLRVHASPSLGPADAAPRPAGTLHMCSGCVHPT